MGFTFILLLLVNVIAYLISCIDNETWSDRKNVLKWLCPIFSTLALILCGVVIWHSYTTYVELRATYNATIEQYATSVEMYGDKAVIDVERAALTDFKYQGYQINIAAFIKDLRGKLATYNSAFVSKKEYKKNWFFGWLIIPPDADMKIMSMKTAKDHQIKSK
jgi:hypothetical protein